MTDDDIRSATFQTKTESSSEKISSDRGVDPVSHWSQTRAIRFGGRKAESIRIEPVADALGEARSKWLQSGDALALRATLLRLLLMMEAD